VTEEFAVEKHVPYATQLKTSTKNEYLV